jgi:hypothetical protein
MGKSCKSRPEFFKIAAYTADRRLARISDEQKILRLDAQPLVGGITGRPINQTRDNRKAQNCFNQAPHSHFQTSRPVI